jgi:DNA-binding CsgD family transcriptional regulator
MAGVVGRDEELSVVETFLGEIASGPAALLLAGEVGVGKTILWEAGLAAAGQRFGNVLTCRGVEAEATLSFAGLSELLAPVLTECLPVLAPPRRRALEVALLLEEPGDMVPDAHAVGLAVLDVLKTLSDGRPLVLGIDDLHWLDPASAAVLQIAFRRLRDEPIALLATLREAPGVSAPIDLDRCFTAPRVRRLRLGPLTLSELHQVLRQELGLDLSRPDLVRVNEATAGNPFFALELGRELTRLGVRLQPGEPLPVSGNVSQLLRRRLARLSIETQHVLLVVALAGRPTVGMIVSADGNHDRVDGAFDEASAEAVVEVEGERVRFVHPLLSSVVHEQASPGQRRRVHDALARVVTDVEERARHRALATRGRDMAVAAEVAAAAEHAAARGATAPAAELCELAAELTPDDLVLVRERQLRAATLHRLAGDRTRAVEMLEHLRAGLPPSVERADVLFELAVTRRVATAEMIQLCDQALAEAAGDDVRCARLLAYRSFAHMFAADVSRALVDARAALQHAEHVGDPTLIAIAIARIAQAETYAADVTPGLLERGAEIEIGNGLALEYYESPGVALARLQLRLGDVERAREILEHLCSAALTRGDEGTRAQVLWSLSTAEWLAGQWKAALDHAVEAEELAEQTGEMNTRVMTGRIKALIEADLGLVEQARASTGSALADAEARQIPFFTIATLGVVGRLELSLGNHEAAGHVLRDLPRQLVALGIDDPVPLWPDTIETLVALGELEQAADYLEQYETNARRLQSPIAIAAAARCRALVTAAVGDLPRALADAQRALTELARFGYPFERGRALLVLGSIRRQAQQKGPARTALEQALAIFEELGARLWADQARRELARISGRPPAASGLSETERRVAALAADGRSNREIAAALYMGLSTVEAHLSHVYRKLGVRRAGLARRLHAEAGAVAKPVGDGGQS